MRTLISSCITANGYVYETFGISKQFPVKLQLLLIRDGTLRKALTAKCFIYDVCALHEQQCTHLEVPEKV